MRGHGVRSSFLGVGTDASEALWLDGFPCTALAQRAAGELARALERASLRTVLLHYSGYGFARRGVPAWLVGGLERWKAGGPERRLVVMFHELWASGPIWRSSFWTSRMQRLVTARVLDLADLWMTNAETHGEKLRGLAPAQCAAACLPVFSNIGEAVPQVFEDRPPAAAVFGQEGSRRLVYVNLADFEPLLKACGIERLIDIGSGDAVEPRPNLQVDRLGYLPAEEVSAALGRCRLGLLCYPLDYVAKSGIFAAYAAHGLAPVLRTPTRGHFDGLRAGVNLLTTSCDVPAQVAAAAIAGAAAAWYQRHNLQTTSAIFADALHRVGMAPCAS